MDVLLQLVIGASFAVPCPQPFRIALMESQLWPIQSAEVCYIRAPKRVLGPQLQIA